MSQEESIHRIERSKLYRETKQKYQEEWRPKIFERDGHKCRACGSPYNLQLAHITTVRAFVIGEELEEAMRLAYSDDNLVTLCSDCHGINHGAVAPLVTQDLGILLDKQKEMRKDPKIQEWLSLVKEIGVGFRRVKDESEDRKHKVDRLFREIKADRGWSSAKEKKRDLGIGEAAQRFKAQKEYEKTRLEIAERCSLKNGDHLFGTGTTIWTGSSTPVLFNEERMPCGVVFYRAVWDSSDRSFPHGIRYAIEPPSWDHRALKELWDAYVEFRQRQGKTHSSYRGDN